MESVNDHRLWTRDFALVWLANLTLFTSFYSLMPTLPGFVTDVLQGSPTSVGLVMGTISLTAVLSRPAAGYALDTFGRRWVARLALLAFAVMVFAYRFVPGLALLVALRALHGLSWGMGTTGGGTLAADIVPAARRGEGLGYYGMAGTLAMAISPLVAVALTNRWGYSTLFMTATGIASLSAVLMWCVSPKAEVAHNENPKPLQPSEGWQKFIEPKVLVLAAIMIVIALVYSALIYFIPLYTKQLGIESAGPFYLVYAAGVLVLRPIAGRFYDRHGPSILMGLGFAVVSLGYVVLALSRGAGLLFTAAGILGLGFGILHPTSQTLALEKVPPLRRGAANATVFSAFDLGLAVGGVVLGRLSQTVGLQTTYAVCAGLTLLGPAIYYGIENRRSPVRRVRRAPADRPSFAQSAS